MDRRIPVGLLTLVVMGGVGAAAFLPERSLPSQVTASRTTAAHGPAATAPRSAMSATAPSNVCTHPNFTTSSRHGGATYGRYYVTNNMWNPLSVHQTLSSCSYDRWYVEASMTSQGGAVQTYPNAQMTFDHRPALRSLASLSTTFADATRPSGRGYDYEYAYDIWINGYGGAGTSELMIWNYNNGQSPGGTRMGTFATGGHTFDVYLSGTASSGDYVAFVARSNFTSGTYDLVAFFQHAVAKGWVEHTSAAKLWQVDYGVEICSTNGHRARFGVGNFDVSPVYASATR